MKNIKVYAYHGVLESEKKKGQNFYIDVEMKVDLRKASTSDNVSNTVDYSVVHDEIVDLVQLNNYNLIETLAEEIAKLLLKKPAVNSVSVEVRKPEAPIQGEFDYVAVSINRTKEDYI